MQALPFMSVFTRSASIAAAMPLKCLPVSVTWLNLTRISPGSR
jgi:hypothetical protein